jgi:hypothetical protein
MPTWHFYGEIQGPPGSGVSVTNIARRTWDETAALGLFMSFDIEIIDSKVHVTCQTNRDNPYDLGELRMRSQEFVSAYVNLINFRLGRALSVTLNYVVTPAGGAKQFIDVSNPQLGEVVTAFADITDFKGMDQLVLGNPLIMRLLDTLITGLSKDHHTLINCARVIDGIKHDITPNDVKDKHKWRELHNALNIDESYLKLITDESATPRHGKLPIASHAKINELLLRTWTAMDRYLVYVRSGRKKLPYSSYPLLLG